MPPVRHWTADEINIMNVHYGKMPNIELQKRYLPNRNVRAIELKALKMGLTQSQSKRTWSDEELEILAKAPKDMTLAEIQEQLLPQRSEEAIGQKRRLLRLGAKPERHDHMTGQNRAPWSEKEVKNLQKYYPTMTIPELQAKYLPNRSRHAIENMARVLAPATHRIWTPAEVTVLKKLYATMPTQQLQEQYLTEKTVAQIQGKAVRLGISQATDKKRWTRDEIKILNKHYEKLSNEKLANMLPGRTPRSVSLKLCRMGLRR